MPKFKPFGVDFLRFCLNFVGFGLLARFDKAGKKWESSTPLTQRKYSTRNCKQDLTSIKKPPQAPCLSFATTSGFYLGGGEIITNPSPKSQAKP